MLWSEGCVHLPMRLYSPTRAPPQLAEYCVFQIHDSDVWWLILRVKHCPLNCILRCWEISIHFCVIIFGHYIIFGQAELYGLFYSNLQWLSFKFNLHLLLLHLVGCVLICNYVCNIVCVCVCVFTCISTLVRLIYWRPVSLMNPRLIVTVYLIIFTTAP